MKPILLGAMAFALLMTNGCTPRAVTIETYTNDGVEFSHQSDWPVNKDAHLDNAPNVRSIRVDGPDHAIVCLICIPPTSGQTIDEFAASVANDRIKEVDKRLSVGSLNLADTTKGTSESTTANVSGHPLTGIEQHFTITLLGMEVPHEAKFFCIEGGKYKIMIMTQAAESHVDSSKDGFDVILNSLKIDGE